VQYACPLKYAVNLLVIIEFNPASCVSSCDQSDDVCLTAALSNCEAVLKSIDADSSDTGLYCGILAALFVIYRVGGLFLLRQKAKTVF